MNGAVKQQISVCCIIYAFIIYIIVPVKRLILYVLLCNLRAVYVSLSDHKICSVG